jgi:hypothetical protein
MVSVLEDFPSLDDHCSANFRYRDLVEVGETWRLHRIDNWPKQLATYQAIRELCFRVLEPVIERFGPIELTYAFASAALDKLVHTKPLPNTSRGLDQHAGCELNRNGRHYCARLGLGVDFRTAEHGSHGVAQWIVQNTGFDRLYFYGDDRPVHVSVGPDNAASIVVMREVGQGRLMPRNVTKGYFGSVSVKTRSC